MLLIFKSSSHSKFSEISGPEQLSTVLVPLQDDLDPAERSGRFLKERLLCRLEGYIWKSWNCLTFPCRGRKGLEIHYKSWCLGSVAKRRVMTVVVLYEFGGRRTELRSFRRRAFLCRDFSGLDPKHESQTCNPGTWSFEGIGTEQLKVQRRF